MRVEPPNFQHPVARRKRAEVAEQLNISTFGGVDAASSAFEVINEASLSEVRGLALKTASVSLFARTENV